MIVEHHDEGLSLAAVDEFQDLNAFEKMLERHLVGIVGALGGLQVLFAIFAALGRLNPTVASAYELVDIFVDTKFWAGIYLISGCITLMAVRRPDIRALSMALSAATFGVWGLLCIVKSLTTILPVAYTIGVAVMGLGWVSYKLCLVWGIVTFDPAKAK